LSFHLRSGADPNALRTAISEIVGRMDANLPVVQLRTVETVVRDNIFIDRFIGTLAGVLALLAAALASIGVYGVLSYSVSQRVREIGLRLALGAAPKDLRAMVLRQVALMGAIGVAVGLAVALVLGRAAGALLYGMKTTDLGVLVAAAATLAAVIAVAGYVPARRASRTDPRAALRHD
jgi:ABC-type antimicrobial peptide transport system permease subunit